MSDLSWVHQDSEAAVEYIEVLERESLKLAEQLEEARELLCKVLRDSDCGVVPKSHLNKIAGFLEDAN